jgi:prolyl oligopeptidase
MFMRLVAALAGVVLVSFSHAAPPTADPYLWLEDVTGDAALEWVHKQDDTTRAELEALPEFKSINQRLRDIYDSQARIPYPTVRGGYYYNFWQDDQHVRGLWRRTTASEYRKSEPKWDVLIDLDALGAAEHESWVWQSSECLFPEFKRCLVVLSRAGGDSHVVREFDLEKRRFVEDGFVLPEAKSDVGWIDLNTIYVGTDFGPGTLTDSGYPRLVKRWKRGTPLVQAVTVFEGRSSDVAVGFARVRTRVGATVVWHDLLTRQITFFTSEQYLLQGGKQVRLAVPDDADVSLFSDQILVRLRSDWQARPDGPALPQGALLAAGLDAFLAGSRDFTALYTPGTRKSLAEQIVLKDELIIHELDEMKNYAYRWVCNQGKWSSSPLAIAAVGETGMAALDADASNQYLVAYSSPLQAHRLSLAGAGLAAPEALKSDPEFFDARAMNVEYFNARSRDGTSIPYFVVTPAGFKADGSAATLLYGYGGFEIPMLPPGYSAGVGASWLSHGGVFVLAGLRGGGEFGPAWHSAAMREKKQNSYDDMVAIAEDLIVRGITSPAHLGIEGGSNGGLMVGAVMLQRPDLFKAVVCQAPLLDMRRYTVLLAGASWMGEYGDPELAADWAFISKYSPYQNVRPQVKYPRVLFETSTRDDRVHPGHARKMAALMEAMGSDVLFYENTEGGHAGSADNVQRAYIDALAYSFLLKELR